MIPASLTYAATLVPDCPWSRLNPRLRRRLVWAPLGDHLGRSRCRLLGRALLAMGRGIFGRARGLRTVDGRFRPLVFPAQLRIAYAALVALGPTFPT